jgi:hypothetical protein
MPTDIHEVHQRWAIDAVGEWIFDGLLNREENRLLCAGVGTSVYLRFRWLIILLTSQPLLGLLAFTRALLNNQTFSSGPIAMSFPPLLSSQAGWSRFRIYGRTRISGCKETPPWS